MSNSQEDHVEQDEFFAWKAHGLLVTGRHLWSQAERSCSVLIYLLAGWLRLPIPSLYIPKYLFLGPEVTPCVMVWRIDEAIREKHQGCTASASLHPQLLPHAAWTFQRKEISLFSFYRWDY